MSARCRSDDKSEIKTNCKILLYIYVICTHFNNFYLIRSEFVLNYDVRCLLNAYVFF